MIRGSYIPISSRSFDRKDLCAIGTGDSYWCDSNDGMYNNDNYHNSNKYYHQERSNYNNYTKKNDKKDEIKRNITDDCTIENDHIEFNKNKFGYSSQLSSNAKKEEFKPIWYTTAQKNLITGKKILDNIGIEIENVKVLHCPQAYGVVVTVTIPERVKVQTPVLPILPDTPGVPVLDPQPDILPLDNNVIDSGFDTRGLSAHSHPLILTSNNGINKMKIVYSGDTRPSSLLCEVGRDCALLIHEATFEDDETGNKYLCTYTYVYK